MNDVKETGRIEAFSDGVFAVAITLLVLAFLPPPPYLTDNALLQILLSRWPELLAFVTSFATIGIMWINHHRLFTVITRLDNALLGLNLLLLLLIVFVPFPTALVAQYVVYPTQHVAAILFSGVYLLLATVFNLLWHYAAYENRLLSRKVNIETVRSITRQYRFGPLLYLITFTLAWIYTPASLVLNLLLAIFFALPCYPRRQAV
ncbi:MAG: DUF1211 domain-containing protein [Ktedonobacteraceae bacterium]|nr:DUF1211 domain-containing protein [Ktedonobacteraceae bacterium]